MENMKTFDVDGILLEMVKVEGGVFRKGAQNKDSEAANYDLDSYEEGPVEEVKLDSYYIERYAVTQQLWAALKKMPKDAAYVGDSLPVIWVSYYDVRLFLEALNGKLHRDGQLDEDLVFDLPDEAEWEYAARGGQKSQGFMISGGPFIDEVAWYASKTDTEGPQPVALKQPNELGLFDMSGNTDEWTTTSKSGKFSIRGGHWCDEYNNCRITARKWTSPFTKSNNLGFRLVIHPKR